MNKKIIGYGHALPVGVDRHNIPELLHHLAASIPETFQVKDIVLQDVDVKGDVPSFSIYGYPEVPFVGGHSEYTRMVFTSKSESAKELAKLFSEASAHILKENVSEIYDVVLHQEVSNPYPYSLTLYY